MSRRNHNVMHYGAYPTDANGFAVPVRETRVPYIPSEHMEVHHHNFYARNFGKLAISQTFRDLKSQQTLLTQPSHQRLHQYYEGIALPPIANMLDYIESAQFLNDKLNIREPYIGYIEHDIDDYLMWELHREYNSISHKL